MFLYSVWFRNTSADVSDQDYEWVACFQIEAESHQKAIEWGDHLSHGYCKANPEEIFISSNVEFLIHEEQVNLLGLPIIQYGFEASALEIGW